MTVLLSDIRNQVKDFGQNFTATTIDKGSETRAINRAIEYVQRRLGLPSDKKVFSFYFYNDTKFYATASAFNEPLELYYNTTANTSVTIVDKNNARNFWILSKDTEILRDTANFQFRNRWAYTTLNGSNQLMLSGANIYGNTIINSFDTTTGLTYSSDIVSAAIDTFTYQQGAGSLKFNINTGLSKTTVSFTTVLDVRTAILNNAAYRLYVNFPTGTSGYFSNVEIQLQSSAGNYYTMNTTTKSDGTAWTENAWIQLAFFHNNATTVGSPDASSITQINIILNHSGTFAAVTNIRFDNFYQITPDYLDCLYYSAYKGTDASGVTSKVLLDTDSDIVSFGTYAPDLILPISLKAALILWPQLRSSTEFWSMYKQDFTETLNTFGRVYPRQRASGQMGQTLLRR